MAERYTLLCLHHGMESQRQQHGNGPKTAVKRDKPSPETEGLTQTLSHPMSREVWRGDDLTPRWHPGWEGETKLVIKKERTMGYFFILDSRMMLTWHRTYTRVIEHVTMLILTSGFLNSLATGSLGSCGSLGFLGSKNYVTEKCTNYNCSNIPGRGHSRASQSA